MSNAITFEVNNGRKLQLIQRKHDGDTEIVTFDAHGEQENSKELTRNRFQSTNPRMM